MAEGDEEKSRRRDGQERNRDDSLLERGNGKNSGEKTREFGNPPDRNAKLHPAHAESNQDIEKLPAEMKKQEMQRNLSGKWFLPHFWALI